MKKTIYLLLLSLITSYCIAAKLTFHDGSSLEAKIIDASNENLILEYNDSTMERSRHEIASIENIDTSEQLLLNQVEQERKQKSHIHQSAYDTLSMFKEKLQLNFEAEKNELINNFQKEKVFLEKNLELLAKKYATLSQDFESSKLEISSLMQKLNEQKKNNESSHEKIILLKNEISFLNESRLKGEVAAAEKIQEAITKNKKLLEKEKFSIIDTYEAQLIEINKQLNEANLKSLKLIKENSDLSEKLANSEKLSDQNGSALLSLEKEFENYKICINNEIASLKEKNKEDQFTLQKLLNQSAEKIIDKDNEIKTLKEKLAFKDEELLSAKKEIEQLKNQNSILESENDQLKKDSINSLEKQKQIRMEVEETEQKVLKSLVDSVLLEEGYNAGIEQPKDATAALQEAKNIGYMKASDSRSALFKLFQDDINKISRELESSKNELLALKNENVILKTDIQKSELQLKEIESKKQEAEDRAKSFQNEKDEMKNEIDKILTNIREETKKELEEGKAELKEELQQAMSSFDMNQNDSKTELQELNLNEPPLITETKEIKEIKELPFEEILKESPSPVKDEKIYNDKEEQKTEKTVIIEVGSISQIEEEFSRIFIDTTENLKENDKVYVTTPDGELTFSIIHIYTAINGAIAETSSQTKLTNVKVGDKVYIK